MTTDKDRAEFEAWYGTGVSWSDGVHKAAWLAWQAARSRSGAVPVAEAYAYQARFWVEQHGKHYWSRWQSCTREQHEAVQRGEKLYNAKAESIALYTAPPAEAPRGVAAWHTDDGRVISAKQKADALRDGGASASSVASYTRPSYFSAIAHDRMLQLPADGAYIIRYDDADEPDEFFARSGARDAALTRYEQRSLQWNAHLFAKIHSNSRDEKCPNAAFAAPADARDGEYTKIGAQLERAAKVLPHGWAIWVRVEEGSASVYVEDPDGNRSDHVEDDGGFAAEIARAIDSAMGEGGGG